MVLFASIYAEFCARLPFYGDDWRVGLLHPAKVHIACPYFAIPLPLIRARPGQARPVSSVTLSIFSHFCHPIYFLSLPWMPPNTNCHSPFLLVLQVLSSIARMYFIQIIPAITFGVMLQEQTSGAYGVSEVFPYLRYFLNVIQLTYFAAHVDMVPRFWHRLVSPA